VAPACEEPGAAAVGTAGADGRRLDLNRATPGAPRVAGISWRLAARIIAARDGVEGREAPRSAPEVDGPEPGTESLGPDTPGTSAAEPAPDVDPP
jgi:hypothetical protein